MVSGDSRTGIDGSEQRSPIVEALRPAAPLASAAGLGLLLEPLNTRVDHQRYFLDSTLESLEVIRAIDRPAVRLLYDTISWCKSKGSIGDCCRAAPASREESTSLGGSDQSQT